jgi:hypothetical protein
MSSLSDNSSRTAFHLRATVAPDVLPRCLELMTKRNVVPVYWHAEVVGDVLEIAFELDGIDAHLEAYMAECLRRIVNVDTVVTSRAVARQQRQA